MESTPNLSSAFQDAPYQRLILGIDNDLEGDSVFEAVRTDVQAQEFSSTEYFGFFTVGLSMMWTWSMILQAVPYFQRRFREIGWVLKYFQAFYLLFFAITMFAVTVCLSMQQEQPSYKSRLKTALLLYIGIATALMLSTLGIFHVTARVYFPFVLLMVIFTAVANALSQNAAFAFAAGFGRIEYAPAIMTGEALAGLLPSTIEIFSALAFPSYFETEMTEGNETSWLTSTYFLSAIVVGSASLYALGFLKSRSPALPIKTMLFIQPKWAKMFPKLKWPALANFLCLCISSVSPIFIARVVSVVPQDNAPVLYRPQAFIPLAIILWNAGELLGSLLAVSSKLLIRHPLLICALSLARLVFIPLYLLCNVDGRGSFAGDWFYLIIVQLLFGLTHGWLSGASMMGVPAWIAKEEREEAGAFMGMTLVAGLVAGSILGLVVAQA